MSTPMLEQYFALKSKYPDTLLLFRLGDFYEGFDKDAIKLSKILGLTLTHRGEGQNRLHMAGIPYHALKNYLPKLIKANIKVAIADQLNEPVPGQLVKRDITKIVTAGTIIDENDLDPDKNNYICSLFVLKKKGFFIWGLSYADISTGEFKAIDYTNRLIDMPPSELIMDLYRLDPSEIILPSSMVTIFKNIFPDFNLQKIDDRYYFIKELKEDLLKYLNTTNLKSFGINDLESSLIAASKLLEYLKQNRLDKMSKLSKIQRADNSEYMYLDEATLKSLEILYPIRGSDTSKTLYSILNECLTPMGQRLLRSWIIRPLNSRLKIINRHDCVSIINENKELEDELRKKLSEIGDLERTISKVTGRSANARDLIYLSTSLTSSLKLCELVFKTKLKDKLNNIQSNDILNIIRSNVIDLINNSISNDPPVTITDGDIIKQGYNKELDNLRKDHTAGKTYIKELEQREIKRTGISSLKVRYNQVFGYYIEVTKANLIKIPKDYIRKQTLVNAERFITEELKLWEDKIINAAELINNIEYRLFDEIRNDIVKNYEYIIDLAKYIAEIDVYTDLSYIANKYLYIRPTVLDFDEDTEIIDSRHPVVERFTKEKFIPNDIVFKKNESDLIVLTGPNMAGKSTYIRQVALIFLLTQIGSYIPASKATISITDRIFTRVGASDDLASGESTFMVEMLETANILNNATQRSLLILDEVGRGTSSYDGMAIAWSIIEYIVNNIKARSLFATHYHDLLIMEDLFNNIKNYNIQVKESEGEVIFLHKIVKGGIDKSYGIHVAKLAGVPLKVINRAVNLQDQLQKKSVKTYIEKHKLINDTQIDLISHIDNKDIKEKIFNDLCNIDTNKMTPIDALNYLQKIKDKINI